MSRAWGTSGAGAPPVRACVLFFLTHAHSARRILTSHTCTLLTALLKESLWDEERYVGVSNKHTHASRRFFRRCCLC